MTKELNEDELNDDKSYGIISKSCPHKYPYLCTTKSSRVGLCRKEEIDCNKIDIDYENVNMDGNIIKLCGSIIEKKDEIETNEIILYDKKTIDILSWNIWGSVDSNEELMMIRMEMIGEELHDKNPDIICLQDTTKNAMNLLKAYSIKKGFYGVYKEYYNMKPNGEIPVCLMTKVKPERVEHYVLTGSSEEITYLSVLIYNNIIVLNTYLGDNKTKREEKWYNLSRCRIEQIITMKEIIMKYLPRDVILCGSFGTDLDSDYPEINFLEGIGKDCWKEIRKGNKGFTIDSSINQMRILRKGETQKESVRSDGILMSRGSKSKYNLFIRIIYISQIGTIGKKMDPVYHKEIGKSIEPIIHPSDHFGLYAQFYVLESDSNKI
jgi:hypothetical protein